MKKVVLVIMTVFIVFCVTSCFSIGQKKVEYIDTCALPGDGSNLVPGTFTLPSGKRVSPGSAVEDGDYVYAVGKGVNQDTQIATQDAKMVIFNAVSSFLGASVHSSAQTGYSSANGISSSSSQSQTLITSDNIAKGLSEFGSRFDSNSNTVYLLMRMPKNFADALKSGNPDMLDKAMKALGVINKATNIGLKIAVASEILN